MNIKEALEYGINLLEINKIEEPILKTKILLAVTLNKNKEYLIINENEKIQNNKFNLYKSYIESICNNIPLQYIIKHQEFMGLDFYVDERVLIPQPDTEILVKEVLNIIKKEKSINVLDLCTGSGAIAIAVKKNIDNVKVTATDISPEALDIAKLNANNNNTGINFICSDLFSNIDGKYDIIVSNPPYIKTNVIKTLSKEVQKEPSIALDGGQDGLDFYRRIIDEAHKHLLEDGYLCLEIGYDQKKEVIDLINKNGNYKDTYSKKDLSGNDRIIICKKK